MYNPVSGGLIVADKGLDQNAPGVPSKADVAAVFTDGEFQAHQAVQFLEQSLSLVKAQNSGPPPSHVVLTGHSLGGPFAIAQGLDIIANHPSQSFEVVNFESIGSSLLLRDSKSGAFDLLGHHQPITDALIKAVADHAIDFYAPNAVVSIGPYTGTPHLFGPEIGHNIPLPNANHDMETITPSILALVADHHNHEESPHDLVAHQLPNSGGHSDWILTG